MFQIFFLCCIIYMPIYIYIYIYAYIYIYIYMPIYIYIYIYIYIGAYIWVHFLHHNTQVDSYIDWRTVYDMPASRRWISCKNIKYRQMFNAYFFKCYLIYYITAYFINVIQISTVIVPWLHWLEAGCGLAAGYAH